MLLVLLLFVQSEGAGGTGSLGLKICRFSAGKLLLPAVNNCCFLLKEEVPFRLNSLQIVLLFSHAVE